MDSIRVISLSYVKIMFIIENEIKIDHSLIKRNELEIYGNIVEL